MKTITRFTFDTVRFDQENDLHLVVTLKAPKKDWEKKRAPVCIFPVIDISGSMAGYKIDYAKKSAIKLVEHLQEGDYAGLAVFDDEVELISKPLKMTNENKEKLRQRIGDLHSKNCTNFSGGMLMGLSQVNGADVPKDVILRVIMLTDGMANRGVAQTHKELVTLLEQNIGKATLSCFGYGYGANQELMADLAKIGKGNYAFIQNPDDALSAFAKELGGLLSTYAQNIELKIESNNGHLISEVVSDVDVDGNDKEAKIKLPEILSEEERNIVLAVKLSKQTKALPRLMNIFNVNISYDVVTESGKLENKKEELKARIKFVKSGSEQTSATQEVDEIVALAQTVKAQVEAEKLANTGEYAAAAAYMSNVSGQMRTRGRVSHALFADKIGERVKTKAAFNASEGYRNSTKSLGTRAVGTASAAAEALTDISCFVSDLSNDAQKNLVDSFTTNEQPSVTIITPSVNVPATNPNSQASELDKKSISKSRSKRW